MTTLRSGPRDAGGDTDRSPLLSVRDLSICFRGADRDVYAVNRIDFDVHRGEIFAIVGESGSGKSVTALSVMGLVPSPPGEITGSIRLEGRELVGMANRTMRSIRGRHIGMVFQDPMSSLNPVHPVGRQIAEGLRLHTDMSRAQARKTAVDLLGQVGIPDPARRVTDYPHEFSGGMRQRAMIAMALACDPKLLIADEPTTALDVTVQNQIVELVRRLQEDRGMAVIWITHDLGVVAEIADRVAVMYGGRIMETGTAGEVYGTAKHPYTSGLLRSIPRIDASVIDRLAEIPGTPRAVTESPTGCVFHHRCPLGGDDCSLSLPELQELGAGHQTACIHHEQVAGTGEMWVEAALRAAAPSERTRSARVGETIVRIEDLAVHFPGRGARSAPVRAVDGVDLTLERGRTLGVVGESGCGKTTLGRALVGLVEPTRGSITIDDGAHAKRHRTIQMIFQDPFSSMNPGWRIKDVVSEPLRVHSIGEPDELEDRVGALLVDVGLSADVMHRHPHQFSGGQRQRVAVARALAAEPEVIVCDEPVSALDVSVQAQIVNLLRDLQDRVGISYMFIAHDLAVVRHISDEVAVMYLGQVVERADRESLYLDPLHPYTRALLDAVPVPDPFNPHRSEPLRGDLPSPAAPPAGCRFHTRCPIAVPGLCDTTVPNLDQVRPGRWVSCHLVERTAEIHAERTQETNEEEAQ